MGRQENLRDWETPYKHCGRRGSSDDILRNRARVGDQGLLAETPAKSHGLASVEINANAVDQLRKVMNRIHRDVLLASRSVLGEGSVKIHGSQRTLRLF